MDASLLGGLLSNIKMDTEETALKRAGELSLAKINSCWPFSSRYISILKVSARIYCSPIQSILNSTSGQLTDYIWVGGSLQCFTRVSWDEQFGWLWSACLGTFEKDHHNRLLSFWKKWRRNWEAAAWNIARAFRDALLVYPSIGYYCYSMSFPF